MFKYKCKGRVICIIHNPIFTGSKTIAIGYYEDDKSRKAKWFNLSDLKNVFIIEADHP